MSSLSSTIKEYIRVRTDHPVVESLSPVQRHTLNEWAQQAEALEQRTTPIVAVGADLAIEINNLKGELAKTKETVQYWVDKSSGYAEKYNQQGQELATARQEIARLSEKFEIPEEPVEPAAPEEPEETDTKEKADATSSNDED